MRLGFGALMVAVMKRAPVAFVSLQDRFTVSLAFPGKFWNPQSSPVWFVYAGAWFFLMLLLMVFAPPVHHLHGFHPPSRGTSTNHILKKWELLSLLLF